ncbi:MAG: FHIPEP family type III secretion protein [Vulcanimicrobiota bacterium]
MTEPEPSGQENSNSTPSDGLFRDALSEITKNLQWDKMLTDGDTGREVLTLTTTPEERYKFLSLWKSVARDVALETGVLLPSVSFLEGTGGELTWGDEHLGCVQGSDETELFALLKRNAWRFLSIRQVEARLKKLWADRPELHRAYEEVSLGQTRTVRTLRRLLREGYSLKSFASVMECLILVRSQYSAQADLVEAVIAELDRPKSTRTRKQPEKRPSTGQDFHEQSRSYEILVQLGKALLCLVEPGEGMTLLERVSSLRLAFAHRTGFVLPGIHFADKLDMDPNLFRILVRDEVCFEGEVHPKLWLAIGPEHVQRNIRGIHTQDPIYGMPAAWVVPALREECESKGCMLFTPESVISMAITETLSANLSRLFTYGYLVEGLLKSLKSEEGPLVDLYAASPTATRLAKLVFVRLLEERISIRDHVTILETVLEYDGQNLSAWELTEIVRKRLAGTLCAPHLQGGNILKVTVLSAGLEELCRGCLDQESRVLKPDFEQERKLAESFKLAVEALREAGHPEILLTSAELRRPLRDFLCANIPTLTVLSRDEIPARVELLCVGEIASRLTPAPNRSRSFPRGRRLKTRLAKGRKES